MLPTHPQHAPISVKAGKKANGAAEARILSVLESRTRSCTTLAMPLVFSMRMPDKTSWTSTNVTIAAVTEMKAMTEPE